MTILSAILFDHCEDDVFWCTADISWIVGHAMKIYGPLKSGQTTLRFEDKIEISRAKRCYSICEKFRVTRFYSSPSIFSPTLPKFTKFQDTVFSYTEKISLIH